MKRLIVFFLLLGALEPTWSQDKGSSGPAQKTVKQELRLKKQVRKERKERRRLEKAERKKIKKHHKRIQSKKVRKRMKESKSTAVRNNDNKREFFMKRWFKKKNKGRAKPRKKD